MDNRSRETLLTVEQDDANLTELWIGPGHDGRFMSLMKIRQCDYVFASSCGNDYSKLGACIGENTHLTKLCVHACYGLESIPFPIRDFVDGLKGNSSIHQLLIEMNNNNIVDVEAAREILNVYQKKKTHLTQLTFWYTSLHNGGDSITADVLRACTNLKQLRLVHCNISNEQVVPIVEAIREHTLLEELILGFNRIGNAGCEAITTLLGGVHCNLHTLRLEYNVIGNEGASAIANGLARNSTLQKLYLDNNLAFDSSVEDIFSRVLCNTSSIDSTYSSNHTLGELKLSQRSGEQLRSLLELNENTNKSHVAIKKILTYHPNINMEPLFNWNMEGDGERNLKALPYVIAWFVRAEGAIAEDEDEESYNLEQRKLDTIYQFACAMPLLFVPASGISKKGTRN